MSLFGVPFLGRLDPPISAPKTPSISTFLAGHTYPSNSTAHTVPLTPHTAVAQLKRSFSAKCARIQGSGKPEQRNNSICQKVCLLQRQSKYQNLAEMCQDST